MKLLLILPDEEINRQILAAVITYFHGRFSPNAEFRILDCDRFKHLDGIDIEDDVKYSGADTEYFDCVINLEVGLDKLIAEVNENNQIIIRHPDAIINSVQAEDALLPIIYQVELQRRQIAGQILSNLTDEGDVLVVFQHTAYHRLFIRAAIESAGYRFGHIGAVTICSVDDSEMLNEFGNENVSVCRFSDVAILDKYSVIIFIAFEDESVILPKSLKFLVDSGTRTYRFGWNWLCRIEFDAMGMASISFNSHDNRHLDNHIFVRQSRRESHGGWYLFPYGYYITHGNGLGPSNAFGHRIAHDLNRLADRSSQHIVIAIFGGSSTYSACTFERSFPHRLEMMLNEHLGKQDQGRRATVLNFGLGANVLLNEISNLILFCSKLKPEIVISHDGYNDLLHGLINDPELVSNHAICYPGNFEQWAQTLTGMAETPLSQSFSADGEVRILNDAAAVVDAFVLRKLQFAAISRSVGAVAISGLQPLAFAKKSSPEEMTAYDFFQIHKQYEPVYQLMPRLYELTKARLMENGLANYIDFQNVFSNYGEDDTHFYDIVHLTPEGDEIIAEIYYDFILENVLTGIQDQKQN